MSRYRVKRNPTPEPQEPWVRAPLHLLGTIDARAFQILCLLLHCSRDKRTCFPSITWIARAAHCSRDTVRRSLRRLEVSDAIRIDERFNDARQTSNTYTIKFSPSQESFAPIPLTLVYTLSPRDLVVLCAHWKCVDYKTKQHRSHIGRLSAIVRMSERTISRANDSLIDQDLLSRGENRKRYGRNPNSWTVHLALPRKRDGREGDK